MFPLVIKLLYYINFLDVRFLDVTLASERLYLLMSPEFSRYSSESNNFSKTRINAKIISLRINIDSARQARTVIE